MAGMTGLVARRRELLASFDYEQQKGGGSKRQASILEALGRIDTLIDQQETNARIERARKRSDDSAKRYQTAGNYRSTTETYTLGAALQKDNK